MSRMLRALLALALIAAPTLAEAKGKKKKGKKGGAAPSGPVRYGMAGCGVNTLLFDEDTKGSQISGTFVRQVAPSISVVSGTTAAVTGILGGSGPLAVVGLALYYGGAGMSLAFVPTWAMTFGTSNCVPNGAPDLAAAEQRLYIVQNRASLEKEAARGEGEHLLALGVLLGCGDQGTPRLAERLQGEHGEIFASADGEGAADKITALVENDDELAETCELVL